MIQGTVKWWNDSKGYGFLTDPEGIDVFIHHSALVMEGFKTLHEGQKVKFNIEVRKHGPAAVNVYPLDDEIPLSKDENLIKTEKQIHLYQ